MLQQLSDSLRVDPSCICARRPTASRIAKKARSKMAATYQAAIDCEPSQSSMLPLLEVQELSGGVPRRVRAGVPTSFSNELFDGKILLFVRDPSIPQASSGPGRRLWEVQMQGRFLRPVDNFFMGMELSDSPKWSFVFRSMSGAMLSFVKTFEPDVHTSFGVSKGNQTELPHLVTPQFKGVDAIVETVDGTGEPPPLGSDLLSAPKGSKSERPQVPRLDATYTMAVFSTFIDLFAWKIKSIPMVGNLDMNSYFRDAGLRIVTYAVPGARDARGSRERAHLEGEKQYILRCRWTRRTCAALSAEVGRARPRRSTRAPTAADRAARALRSLDSRSPRSRRWASAAAADRGSRGARGRRAAAAARSARRQRLRDWGVRAPAVGLAADAAAQPSPSRPPPFPRTLEASVTAASATAAAADCTPEPSRLRIATRPPRMNATRSRMRGLRRRSSGIPSTRRATPPKSVPTRRLRSSGYSYGWRGRPHRPKPLQKPRGR